MPDAPQPLRIVERHGKLVRFANLPGWYVASEMGPCRECGGSVFNLLARRSGQTLLACAACVPPGRKNGEARGAFWCGASMEGGA